MNLAASADPGRASALFWAAFLRNRNVDAGTAGDGAIPVAGGYALYVAGTRFDYAMGAGSTRALRDDDLAVVEEFYAARAHPARFELDESVLQRDGALLRERGYVDDEDGQTIAVLAGPVGTVATPPGAAIAVRTTTNRRAWIDLGVRAFDVHPAGADVLRRTLQIAAAASHVLLVATLDGDDVGAAALSIAGETALLGNAAVLPAFRRRGVHAALTAARLTLAHERGATVAALKTVADSSVERSAVKLGLTRTGLRRRVHRDVPGKPAQE